MIYKNKLTPTLIKSSLKLFVIIYILFINYFIANADEKVNKYHKLELFFNIIDQDHKAYKDNNLAEIIKNNLLIYHAISEPKLTKNRIENLHDRAEQEILSNLESLGYYHAKVVSQSLKELEQNKWTASYEISIGQPTIIKQINIKIHGQANNVIIQKVNHLSTKFLKINERLIHDNYEKTKQIILSYLHDYGFLNSQFITSKIEINKKDATANIIFIVDFKQQYYLGEVIFESDLYEHRFLNKYVPFKEKDLYSNDKLMQLKNNLLNSGLFSKVRIDTEDLYKLKNYIVPIKVRVYAKPANKYSASLGFGTDTGPRGTIGYARHRKSHPGHQISINILGSKIRKKAIIDYSLLGQKPMIDKYNFGIIAAQDNVKKRLNKNIEIYTQKSKHQYARKQFWRISFLTETFKELPMSDKKHAHFLMPSLRLTWVHPKNNISCSGYNCIEQSEDSKNAIAFGNKINFITKIASKSIASSSNLLQFTSNEKWIEPLIYDLRAIFKATIATTVISDFNKLPLSLRFFAGGDNSVRGFAYNSLGPYAKDQFGNLGVIGGKHLFLTSIEIEKPIPSLYQQLSVAWFIDAGNALNSFNLKELAVGTGFGVGYKTPIGSVRAYLAKPIKHLNFEESSKKSVRFHLTFGTDL